MKTAANGGLLFVNVIWHSAASPYGFQFDSPLDVARFVDCLCLGLDSWFWTLEQSDLRVYALAPFTTLSPKYAQPHAYSEEAKATPKHAEGDRHFWGGLLAARNTSSGPVEATAHLTAYPGHPPTAQATALSR